MTIKPRISKRYGKQYLLSIRLPNGKQIRQSFSSKADAERVALELSRGDKRTAAGRGFATREDTPFLSDLIEKRLAALTGAEKTRAERVLNELAALLPPAIRVDQLNKALLHRFVEKRFKDKGRTGKPVKPQSIDRELNIICATLNAAELYYPALEQWRPPRMPRPKILDGPRARVWSEHEIKTVLGALLEPRRRLERARAQAARYRVGRISQFCLLTGLRTGEVAKLKKENIDWHSRKLRVKQGKTGNYKTVGPLFEALEILKEFAGRSATEYVFFQGPNIPPKFYRTLREACDRVGVLYGRDVDGGLRLYDARHTATTEGMEAGINPATIKAWMGWSDSAFLTHYGHPTEASREQLGRRLEELAGKKIA
jgi:integrase